MGICSHGKRFILLAANDHVTALPDQTAAAAFVAVADKFTETFHLSLLALMAENGPEPVHKARVALRRYRAALIAFEPILDEDLAETMQNRARALFRLLGTVRDADVLALRFAGTERAAKLGAEAAQQRHKARKHLKRKKAEAFRPWVMRRLAGKAWRKTGKKAKALREAPVQVLAAIGMDRIWTDCLSNGPDLRVISLRGQHELRKDLKMLRYMTEFFADLWPGEAQERFLETLRTLQDDLGEITDNALAKSLGHPDNADISSPQEHAALAWKALQGQGPWWNLPDREG